MVAWEEASVAWEVPLVAALADVAASEAVVRAAAALLLTSPLRSQRAATTAWPNLRSDCCYLASSLVDYQEAAVVRMEVLEAALPIAVVAQMEVLVNGESLPLRSPPAM